MKKGLLSIVFVLFSVVSFCTTVTIVNSGFKFSPDTAKITVGDSVKFTVASSHQIAEVSQATWNANGNTQLSGGFSTAAGGGLVLPTKLAVGTHWYVCTPHAGGGMKGVIIVKNVTGIKEDRLQSNFSIFPNPTNGIVSLVSGVNGQLNVVVYNFIGEKVLETITNNEQSTINLSEMINGIYFLSLGSKEGTVVRKIIVSH